MSRPADAVTVCAIAGGSGAGKTTLAIKLLERLGARAQHFTIDWYYRDLSHLTPPERDAVNFDHPDSLEVDLFSNHLERLRTGQAVEAPVYDFPSHTRTQQVNLIEPAPIIVTEGIHLLALESVRAHCDLMVFVDVDPDIRLQRRIDRDARERGRTEQSVRAQWAATVAPMHELFVQPSVRFADLVVDGTSDLDLAATSLAERLCQL